MNDYYDVFIKEYSLKQIDELKKVKINIFYIGHILDKMLIEISYFININ